MPHDIHLYTAATMNGYKPVLFLEEAGIPHDLTVIDFAKNAQKAPDHLRLNPNGKIPTIEDRAEGRAIFESGPSFGTWRRNTGGFSPRTPWRARKPCNGCSSRWAMSAR